MDPKITPLDKIHVGRVNWIIKVRVMSIWKVPDFNNPLQTGTMELLLLDKKLHTKEGNTTVIDNLSQQETIVVEDDIGQTLTSKVAGKRCANSIDCYEKHDGHIGHSSSFKIQKLLEVKKEPLD